MLNFGFLFIFGTKLNRRTWIAASSQIPDRYVQPMTTTRTTNMMTRIENLTQVKIFKNILATIFILTLLVSCNGERKENNKTTNQETPEALQYNKLEIKSYSRSGDLTEELYQELVNKNPALKKLEEDLDDFSSKPNELRDKFNKYESKSNSYYSSANNKASAITDSLIKMKIISLITTSNNKYTNKTTELNTLLQQISKNGATLNDHHSVLKIVLTLPIIEKYQDDNKPNSKEFRDFKKQQEKLILQTDSLTPKY